MRIFLISLLVRPLTYGGLMCIGAIWVLRAVAIPIALKDPSVPPEFFELLYLLCLYGTCGIVAAIFGMAWSSRRVYERIYPYILKYGPRRYWAITRFHGGCAYTAFRLAELDTRKLRADT